MKKVITYGTYDLLHEGHINLLRRAKELGDYLIVGVTSDSFDRGRGKLNVRNNVLERVEAVKATGYADEIIIEDYLGQKIDDIQRYDVDIFAIGSDWVGKFDYLNEYCKVVYLPRTEGISSTMLREQSQEVYRIGIVGSGRIAKRFVPESKFVNSVNVIAVYDPDKYKAKEFSNSFGIKAFSNKFEVFLDASKTAFCPSFNHIVTLVKSGVIGNIVDVKTSLSKIVSPPTRELDENQAGGAMNEHAPLNMMAIVRLLGNEYDNVNFYSKIENGVDIYTKVHICYPHATASMTLGIGVKTEGNMIISGTKGYVYVPAPWWLTDYFEIRYEDQTKNKKFFYCYDGDGLRYEIQEFMSMIVNHRMSSYKLRRKESIAIAEIIEKFNKKENYKEI